MAFIAKARAFLKREQGDIRKQIKQDAARKMFASREFDEFFENKGKKHLPNGTKQERIWLGYEIKVDSPYLQVDLKPRYEK